MSNPENYLKTLSEFEGEEFLNSTDLQEACDSWGERVDELTNTREEWEGVEQAEEWTPADDAELSEAEDERDALAEVCGVGRDYIPDWRYGETLIREDAFEDYARDMASDMYGREAVEGGLGVYVDWERYASDVAMDYTIITIGSTDYRVR